MIFSFKRLLVLFVSYIHIHRANGVRIFSNVIPTTYPTRAAEFKREVISKTCTLKPEKGPCRGNIDMYYFDAAKSNCSTFKWGGCQGNGNRFDTEEECDNKCLSKRGDPKRRPKFCMLTYDYGYCFGALIRYYYDHVWKICKKTIYSGCGGNNNNFLYQDQCESACQYGKGFIKSKKKDKAISHDKILIINPESENTEHKKPITSSTAKDGWGDYIPKESIPFAQRSHFIKLNASPETSETGKKHKPEEKVDKPSETARPADTGKDGR